MTRSALPRAIPRVSWQTRPHPLENAGFRCAHNIQAPSEYKLRTRRSGHRSRLRRVPPGRQASIPHGKECPRHRPDPPGENRFRMRFPPASPRVSTGKSAWRCASCLRGQSYQSKRAAEPGCADREKAAGRRSSALSQGTKQDASQAAPSPQRRLGCRGSDRPKCMENCCRRWNFLDLNALKQASDG